MLTKLLAYLQKLVSADKAALVSAALGGLTLLAANFGLNLNPSVTAYLGVVLMALAGAFTHIHFAGNSASRAENKAAMEHYKQVLGTYEARYGDAGKKP